MIALTTTITVFLIVIYITGLRVNVPVSYAKYRGFRSKFPIKLIYASNIPVIFASALFGNIFFISQIIWARYPVVKSVLRDTISLVRCTSGAVQDIVRMAIQDETHEEETEAS